MSAEAGETPARMAVVAMPAPMPIIPSNERRVRLRVEMSASERVTVLPVGEVLSDM
jgi:hypothetical protein